MFVAACVMAPAMARAQDPPNDSVRATRPTPPQGPPAQDVAIEGGGSFGHFRIFAGGEDAKMYIGGVEYDRNSWGRFLGARSDYVAELLPIMRLNESADTDIWGDRLGPGRKILYGAGFSPIGFRLVWGRHAVRPFFSAKAGLDVWDHKFISDQGSYIQFTLHEAAGVLVKLTDQYDLRMDIGDFHQSNGFMTDVNPGLDVASYSAGLVYHLGSGRGRVR
ncbi:MAG TPA: acyloxyacyl hydrolase [Acidobacteriaceae bacterium]|nr:acyloxyacyl hydrolase [Acidobacteriaceae bacterium]